MNDDVTRRLASFVCGTHYRDLPEDVVNRTRALLADHMGIALRARHEADLSTPMAQAALALGMAEGTATVIGDARGYSAAAAALFNGNLAHALDFDDTHAAASLHPSAPILPAALAAAEMVNADGAKVVTAAVLGYETQIRVSLALNPTEHYNRGFHPTATCGVFGAAAAAGYVLGLSEEQMSNAFGLAGSQAAGSMQFLNDGAWNKPFHTGYAAMSGLIAANLARTGFRGAAAALEGKAGFLHGYAPNPNAELVIAGLGDNWETLNIAVKPYPSCRYGHAAMDALIHMRAANDIEIDDIESVEIGLPQTGWNIIGGPQALKQSPKSYVDGQFSMPFVAAVALRQGSMSWDDYKVHLDDPKTLALCKKVDSIVDPVIESEFPANMSGVARVRMNDGGHFEHKVVVAKGEPANFLSDSEIRAKFVALAQPYLGDNKCDALFDAVMELPATDDVARVLHMSRASAPQLKVAGGDD